MTWIVPTGYERREVVGCGYHWLAAASRSVEGGGAQGSLIGLDSLGIRQYERLGLGQGKKSF